ncbi:MAG: gfo/Idh/MocA family oxidoreductase, partial [Bacteroidota bacterium]
PRPIWNPDVESKISYLDGWEAVSSAGEYDNAFKAQWELFLKHVVKDDPFPWSLLEGAKGVQLAEKAYESWQKRRWVEVPELEVVIRKN